MKFIVLLEGKSFTTDLEHFVGYILHCTSLTSSCWMQEIYLLDFESIWWYGFYKRPSEYQ